MGITISGYIDDEIIISDTESQSQQDKVDTIELQEELGYIINYTKTTKDGSQVITHLGFVINSNEMIVTLTEKKKEYILTDCSNLLQKNIETIRIVAKVIGLIVAALPAVDYGMMYYRNLEGEKIIALQKSKGNYDKTMIVSCEMKQELKWWVENLHTAERKISRGEPNAVISSDASFQGWGAEYLSNRTGGRWRKDDAEENQSINFLELKAGFFALKSFCSKMKDTHVHLKMDNTSAISYINHMGGTKVKSLNSLGREIWEWCKIRDIPVTLPKVDWLITRQGETHLLKDRLTLVACLVSGGQEKNRRFQQGLERYCWPHGKRAHINKTLSYSAVNTARSAVAQIVEVVGRYNSMSIGAHPLVSRFMKGLYNLRPPQLTLKLVMLLSLIMAARPAQSLSLLRLDQMIKENENYKFYFGRTDLKQSQRGYIPPDVCIKKYYVNRLICAHLALSEYIRRTKDIRESEPRLFVSYVKPYKAVSRDTISRWVKTAMSQAGIDTKVFKPHSVRAAATSKAKLNDVPLEDILKTAGWSNAATFAKYYGKPIKHDSQNFVEGVLKK
ncbi:uncharacterized protein LOC141906272 [Tubulanus polymorphus]|uniref:uncharacterized protein LOC141906272 n=1 Tax=Tubulanus polymorphus TaxID=672921 RepID=UPI003DA5631F